MKIFQTALVFLCFSLPAYSIIAAEDISDHPGYVNFNDIRFLKDQEPTVEITLRGAILALLTSIPAHFAKSDDEAAAINLLQVIKQVVVRTYSIPTGSEDDVVEFITQTAADIEAQDWVRIVRVREDENSQVDIHVKLSSDQEKLNGIVIMALEHESRGSKVNFINIAGNFNPEDLAALGEKLDIDYIENLNL